MPRPKPLVALHGAVNFDRLVPFNAAPNAPPLAANDILVMRKAAGGDNLTLSIGDITATGSVNIDQLLGGANFDMLYRVAGIWTGTGPTGLTYDGANLILIGDDISLESGGSLGIEGGGGIGMEGGGSIVVDDAGNIEVVGSGSIEQSGSGNIEINGGGDFQVSGGGAIMLAGSMEVTVGNIELSGGSGIEVATDGEITVSGGGGIALDGGATLGIEGGDGINMEGGAGIAITDAGNIEMGTGQILAGVGTLALPEIAFLADPDTGIFNVSPDHFSLVAGGQTVARVREVGNVQFQLKPQSAFQNSPGEPLLQFHNSAMGFYSPSANIISLAFLGAQELSFSSSGFETHGGGGSGPIIRNVGASATVPVIIPNKADLDTGLSRDTVNGLSMVAGALGCIRARNIGGARAVGFYTTTPIIQQTGVAVTAAGIHAACVNLGLFTA